MNTFTVLVGKTEGKDHSQDLDINGKIMLGRILGRQCECGLD